MKERPILFSGPMVRAILDGSKTQTRRIINGVDNGNCLQVKRSTKTRVGEKTHVLDARALCPYGQPCDKLWVREAFCPDWADHGPIYKADGGSAIEAGYPREPRWKPSIHMPRKLSRITLEITGVRIERLHEISEMDAFAEGVDTEGDDYNRAEHAQLGGAQIEGGSPAVFAYKGLWESINGAESWTANPWVWVIEFRRVV